MYFTQVILYVYTKVIKWYSRIVRNLSFILLFLFLLPTLCFANIEASSKYAALVVDKDSKKILYQKNAKARRYPASLVKVATAYMLFEAIEQGRLQMNSRLKVSEHASKQEPVSMYLKKGETISVSEAIDALIVKSANDVSVAIAEAISGTEQKFAQAMTQRVRRLGLNNTNFANASGLPNPNQYTNAVDMVKLAIAVQRDFPQYFYRFGKTSFKFKGRTVKGHNAVLANYPTATGLKTGFTNASGCNIITTTASEVGSLVAVVFGGQTGAQRNNHIISLLDQGYNQLLTDSNYGRGRKSWFANASKPKVGNKGNLSSRHIAYQSSDTIGPVYKKSAFDARGFKPIDSKAVAKSNMQRYEEYEALQVNYGVHEGIVEYKKLAFDAVVGGNQSPFEILGHAQ